MTIIFQTSKVWLFFWFTFGFIVISSNLKGGDCNLPIIILVETRDKKKKINKYKEERNID
jgi:hypothetical protein